MPGTTTPDGLIYPVVGDIASPRAAITQLADSVQDALDVIHANADRVTNYWGPAASKPATAKVGDTYQESDSGKRLWNYDGTAWVLYDSGWVNLTTTGGWTTSSGVTLAQIRRIGPMVYLTGELWAGTSGTQAALIPAEFRPKGRFTVWVGRGSASVGTEQYAVSVPSARDSLYIAGPAGIPGSSPGVSLGSISWSI